MLRSLGLVVLSLLAIAASYPQLMTGWLLLNLDYPAVGDLYWLSFGLGGVGLVRLCWGLAPWVLAGLSFKFPRVWEAQLVLLIVGTLAAIATSCPSESIMTRRMIASVPERARKCAKALDAWGAATGAYPKDESELRKVLGSELRLPTPFVEVKTGLRVPYELVLVEGPLTGAALARPGLVLVSFSPDRKRYWLSIAGLPIRKVDYPIDVHHPLTLAAGPAAVLVADGDKSLVLEGNLAKR